MKKHLIQTVGLRVAWLAVIGLLATGTTMVAGISANTAPCNVAITVNTDHGASASMGMGVQAVQKAFTKAEVATEVRDTGQNMVQGAGTVAMQAGNNADDVGIAPNGGTLAAEIVAGNASVIAEEAASVQSS